jgi:nitroimidazol reductase NimA-like FMN-containing flavoprotein (pyridoxamine 5'-phosphate oxidase superfamily)
MSSPRLIPLSFSHPCRGYLCTLNPTIMMGQLTTDEIENLLQTSILGRIGCTDGKLMYVVPISFVYDGAYVYCHTREGLKVSMLRKNPALCFEVEHLSNLANWQTVVTHGTFEELTDPVLRLEALQKLYARKLPFVTSQTTRLTGEWPFMAEELGLLEGITFRIRLEIKTGRFEKADPIADTVC